MKSSVLSFFIFTATALVFAANPIPPGLGNGRPGLCMIYESTNEYIVFINQTLEQAWKPGDAWSSGYSGHITVLAESNFGPERLSPNNFDIYNTEDLFPFDKNTVFTCDGFLGDRWFPRETFVFSTNCDQILLSTNVYALARVRYGLTTNQWFLGKIGTNIFYWETRKPTRVYFRTTGEKQATHYFKLPKAAVQIFGVKEAISANKDVGFSVVKTLGLIESLESPFNPASSKPTFIEYSIKHAEQSKGGG